MRKEEIKTTTSESEILNIGKDKTATDNQWVSSLHMEDSKRQKSEKTPTDNQWVSTNKNI